MARLFLLLGVLAGAEAGAGELLVFAASSTADALEEVGRAYRDRTGQEVRFSLGASSDLARQLLAGAPGDVFLSADWSQMERIERAGLASAKERSALLSNQLVVVAPKDSSLRLLRAAELSTLKRVALADPEAVPLGVYARRWLEQAGVWEVIALRLVPTLDARAALSAVESGNAEAGIVYATDARASAKVRVLFAAPASESPPIHYPVAALFRGGEAARRFVAFLHGEEAGRIFRKHGFPSPGASSSPR